MDELNRKLNRLTKWRSVFAGWQLGTRPSGDPETQAVRDHREATLLLRAEVSTINALLINKGIYTLEEFRDALGEEAEMLSEDLSRRFPGFTATDMGMSIDSEQARQTMKGWKP